MKESLKQALGPNPTSEELLDLLSAVEEGIDERIALYRLVLFLCRTSDQFEDAMTHFDGFLDAYKLIKRNLDVMIKFSVACKMEVK